VVYYAEMETLSEFALDFDSRVEYQVVVKGKIPPGWSDRLGGMAIRYGRVGETAVTILTGELADQAALTGMLLSLYGLHLPLISVQKLPVDDEGLQIER
jgi:hypothetical protein